jgi:mannitol operon transcriptional antiterminator
MRKRSTEILQWLVLRKNKLNIEKLSKKYDVSQRTLKNDFEEINIFLASFCKNTVYVNDNNNLEISGIVNADVILQHLFQMDIYDYKLSPEERHIYIIAMLISLKDYITMEKIAETLYVTRVTIMGDIECVKDILQEYSIILKTKSGRGITLLYNEEQIRFFLVDLFRKILPSIRSDKFFPKLIIKRLQMTYALSDVVTYLYDCEKKYKINFSEYSFYEIVLYLFVAINRASCHYAIQNNYAVQNKLADDLIQGIKENKNINTEKEKGFFGQYVLDNSLFPMMDQSTNIELMKTILYFLNKVGRQFKIDLRKDILLVNLLLTHIQTMENSMIFTIDGLELPLEFQMIYQETEKNKYILEKFLGYSLEKNMLLSISIHICASIIRNHTLVPQVSVLIVCPGSVATGKFLEAQIKNYFNFNIVGVVAANRVLKDFGDNKDIDFIVTTIENLDLPYPIIVVDAFLNLDNLNIIQQQAVTLGHKRKHIVFETKQDLYKKIEISLNQLEKSIEDLQDAFGLDEFLQKIRYMLLNRKKVTTQMTNIADMLVEEHIILHKERVPWETAIRMVGAILENTCYGSNYIEKMIDNVKQYGTYIVISKGIALAHANADQDVWQEGLSLLVSQEGILFGANKVYLLFCFCTKGDIDYLELFTQIIDLGKHKYKIKNILTSTDSAEILQKIINVY